MTLHDAARLGICRVRDPKWAVGADVLSVHEQREQVCLWALVDPEEKKTEQRMFHIAGTGFDIKDNSLRFIGAVHLYSSSLVFHIFEVCDKRDGKQTSENSVGLYGVPV